MKAPRACIFNIQKFSIHDGPGIRTVVFFKGCPLRCKWCSNPESQRGNVQLLWDRNACVGCRRCEQACSQRAVSFENGRVLIDRARCIGCGACADICEAGALTREGRLYTLEEVLHTAMQDEPFYEESGGGVTLSGGEVLSQVSFAAQLLRSLQERGIHTACETTGYGEKEDFLRLIEYTDLLLFDMKHHDDKKHREGTGIGNAQIIANMTLASAMGKEIIVRIPVIPGFNDGLTDAHGFCDLLTDIGIKRVNLLPFHQFGQKKYELLGLEYAYAGVPQLHPEDLKEYQRFFLNRGFDCTI
ncbi:glycyl-radical enzyme activating protein [Candidatus Soleaferrea massiliensis]|uniref:glycyl-radical enzyme activating protein n=1 Tax=Candidatus Soleaferrea massiliensis TaxID=1470354 RepID=UPI000590E83D|nr:glycyl-radical enzyme activating protein [Candidatus Soleaferrea massiliensis]